MNGEAAAAAIGAINGVQSTVVSIFHVEDDSSVVRSYYYYNTVHVYSYSTIEVHTRHRRRGVSISSTHA